MHVGARHQSCLYLEGHNALLSLITPPFQKKKHLCLLLLTHRPDHSRQYGILQQCAERCIVIGDVFKQVREAWEQDSEQPTYDLLVPAAKSASNSKKKEGTPVTSVVIDRKTFIEIYNKKRTQLRTWMAKKGLRTRRGISLFAEEERTSMEREKKNPARMEGTRRTTTH